MIDETETRIETYSYQLKGGLGDVPAWRYIQTMDEVDLSVGGLRLDGRWYRRLIENEHGDVVLILAVWNEETDMTVVMSPMLFDDISWLQSQVYSSVLPKQLEIEEWQS